MDIRQATIADITGMQNANLMNLPENYVFRYYLYHATTWPQASFVATDASGTKIVGYVLAKLEEEEQKDGVPHGHVTSLSVMRTYRRMGLAGKLMELALRSLYECYGAKFVSLHVRKSNRAALHLYRDTLKFDVKEISKAYYGDGEDAYAMQKDLETLDDLDALFEATSDDDFLIEAVQNLNLTESGKLVTETESEAKTETA
ncbi:NatA N-acetyltransferase complex subunit Ard1 [Myxozyma melibiosi]|uniref:NatA N-acetyltransferase complex subunit Ard1 n=1 Tax=Myxozyma melibiosi TaxID=54550 RepID=A0ABR1F9Z2_9ASCO